MLANSTLFHRRSTPKMDSRLQAKYSTVKRILDHGNIVIIRVLAMITWDFLMQSR